MYPSGSYSIYSVVGETLGLGMDSTPSTPSESPDLHVAALGMFRVTPPDQDRRDWERLREAGREEGPAVDLQIDHIVGCMITLNSCRIAESSWLDEMESSSSLHQSAREETQCSTRTDQ